MRWLKVLILFCTLFSSFSFSDEIRPSYLQIKALGENTYDVLWKVPAKKDQYKLALKVEFDKNIKQIKMLS